MPSVELFESCTTQWLVSPMGTPIGINYPSIESAARAYGIPYTRKLLEDIRLMEHTVLKLERDRATALK